MEPVRIATYGFPGALSELIARSAMRLPDLDTEFLRTMTGIVTTIFWFNFIADLPEKQREEAMKLFEEKNADALTAWMEKHCNILDDEKSMQRANRVLADLEAKLPAVIAEEYEQFNKVTAIEASPSAIA